MTDDRLCELIAEVAKLTKLLTGMQFLLLVLIVVVILEGKK